ncbi:B3 domain-containing protein Os07g0563300-like [Tripterygium wilfordii]|uniref:B3 domain-containing protein Os07g0563300-like n=1 Tax=Tripterygium wilfordii TaxID=458696 RepID=UPI0018F85121|nr:B3 domain-containing protein Os07g0563300-like [Tripterygium wilfordii]
MSHSTSSNVCFNPDCAESKSERPRNGWRLRTGEYVELCDRCCSAFEEGRYCDIFHINAFGWKCCESCGKRVHCGCIVSAHAFTLLDATGIECIACTRKNGMLVSNHAWSPSLFYHAPLHERFKDISIKNWNHLAGSGPVPWRQAASLFHSPSSQPELHPRMPYEVDRLNAGDRLSASSLEQRKVDDFSERFRNGSLKLGAQDVPENGKAGTNHEEQLSSSITLSHQSSSLRDDSSTPQFGVHLPCSSPKDTNGHIGASGIHLQATPPPPLAKQFHGNLHNGVDSTGETQSRNGRPRADGRGRSQLLSRYWPRFTDQELQQISGNTNAIITPLFEKMLSASDAGRIGRLVLPKKCAEAYFPPISQPEGLPLKVQDSKGKEWIFQFRFWPNNNSRMYVLEGVTPCIQNMQLQAGDIVTFSRLEPEGKLIMGFRKASTAAPADQDSETSKTGNGVPMLGDVEFADPSTWSKVDKSGYIAKEALGAKSSIPRKRKSSTLGSKSKRLQIENEDLIELKLTWEEAQGLLRPPLNHSPSVIVIEGFEFEEYEDAPVLGRPTIFATNDAGEKVQWVQCEDCSKWRRLPGNAVLPSKWTCSDNTDPERSCSAVQELTTDQLGNLLPPCNLATSKKMKAAKQEPDNIKALEGLDTLANLAILGEGGESPASSQATTKHPRHRPGCSCIVCIQPPSGKGPKHKQTCTCNVCQTVKRRFRTLMLRREKKQSQREAETTRKKQQESNLPLPEKSCDDDILPCNNTASSSSEQKKVVSDGSDDDPNKTKPSTSPFKGQIDLNIQPEREEELSPDSDSCSMMRLLQDATERYLKQRLSSSSCDKTAAGNQTTPGGGGEGTGEKASNSVTPDSHQEVDKDRSVPSSTKAPASALSTA